ncbi:conserved hypothetical protein [Arthrobacter sp. Hiyo8]|nr:conserved hypothetical protein [Arthrobacter sp. Hiyo8]
MSYTHTVTVDLAWEDAVERTRAALAGQGFGILSEINVRSTFEAKLGSDAAEALGDYVILGACNPALASRAWLSSRTLVPCCRATSLSAEARMPPRPPSRPSIPGPWSSSVATRPSRRSPTTPIPGSAKPLPPLAAQGNSPPDNLRAPSDPVPGRSPKYAPVRSTPGLAS